MYPKIYNSRKKNKHLKLLKKFQKIKVQLNKFVLFKIKFLIFEMFWLGVHLWPCLSFVILKFNFNLNSFIQFHINPTVLYRERFLVFLCADNSQMNLLIQLPCLKSLDEI